MVRTTIMADADLIDSLRALARARGLSFAEIVREALRQKASEFRPKPASLGAFESGIADVRAVHDTGRMAPRSWR